RHACHLATPERESTAHRLHPWSRFPGLFFASGPDNSYVLKRVGDDFEILGVFDLQRYAAKIREDKRGDLWFEQGFSRVARLAADESGGFRLEFYGVEDGLTPDQWIPIWNYGEEVRFSTRNGVLKFDPGERRFVPDEA